MRSLPVLWQKHSLLVVAVLALVALLGSCVYTYRLEVEDPTRTWDATGLSALEVVTANGSIGLEADFGAAVRLDVTRVCYGRSRADAEKYIDRVKIIDTVESGRLRVEAEMPASGGRNYGASFTGLVPADLDLDLHGSNGRVEVVDLKANVRVRTSNGLIELTNTEGRAELHTSNGAVKLKVHHGPVQAENSNGAISADVAELPPGEDVELKTSNGAIDLLVPSGVSARFDASTSNGRVTVSGFSNAQYEVNEPTHKKGTLGSGASEIELKTSNGNIELKAR
ncbi:MAG: DUF4097 family beta strand repeat protein [candidate division WOR-3 bacterium]|nr:MAG: DUF4097 family beta strand repeat protein [candidate division WOR-3 bacterium]